jgi:hypothetical protein
MKFVVILLFAFIPLSLFGQRYFEGSIHYVYTVKVKSKKINSERMQQALGNGSVLIFKDGNFRHNYDGGAFEFDLYTKADNRLYMKKRSNDTIYWYDCSKGGGKSIKNLKVSAQKKNLLGTLCDQLSIQYSDHSVVEYYNADSILIDPQWFVEFKRNDQYKVDAIERSIFLRSEINYPVVNVISEAIKVQRKTVSINVFEIPGGAILVEKK